MSSLDIDINLKLAQFTSGIDRMSKGFDNLSKDSKKSAKAIEDTLNGISRTATTFGATLGTAALAKDILDTNREFEKLRAQLQSVEKSSTGGAVAFDKIKTMARDTPFELQGLTEVYVKLKNFGIEPTTKTMEALTNQASKLGASQDVLGGIVLALGQAYSKGKLQAQDMNQMIERGVPVLKILQEVTGKSTAEIHKMSEAGQLNVEVMDKFIAKMGEMAEGSNARAMDTLNGKISNLSDAWHVFEDTLLNSKGEGVIKGFVDTAIASINALTKTIDDSSKAQILRARVALQEAEDLRDNRAVGAGRDFAQRQVDEKARELKALEQKRGTEVLKNVYDLGTSDTVVNLEVYNKMLDELSLARKDRGITLDEFRNASNILSRQYNESEKVKNQTKTAAVISKGDAAIPYLDKFKAAGSKYDIDPKLLMAIASVESGGGNPRNITQFRSDGSPLMPTARDANGNLISHATGVMQVIPKWHQTGEIDGTKLNENSLRNDPGYNIDRGAQLVAFLLRKYDGDVARVLKAYGGETSTSNVGYTNKVIKAHKTVENVLDGGKDYFKDQEEAEKKHTRELEAQLKKRAEATERYEYYVREISDQTGTLQLARNGKSEEEIDKLQARAVDIKGYVERAGLSEKELGRELNTEEKARKEHVIELVNKKHELLAIIEKEQKIQQVITQEAKDDVETIYTVNEAYKERNLSVDKYLALLKAVDDSNQSEASKNVLKGRLDDAFKSGQEQAKATQDKLDNLTVYADQAARNMQSAFADYLFDPFDKGIEGMAKGFGDVIKRMLAEAAAAQLMKALFGKSDVAGDGILGTVIGGIGSIAGGMMGGQAGFQTSAALGGNPFNGSGAWRLHADGTILNRATEIAPGHIAGEAGPEAVIPMKNMSIPVKLLNGSKSTSSNTYQININMQSTGKPDQDGAKAAQAAMRVIAQEEANKAVRSGLRPGNALNPSTRF